MKKKIDILSWATLLLLAIVWGSSFILMKKGMETNGGVKIFSSNQVGALRMSIAGLVMLPFGIYSWRKITSRKLIFSLIIVGTCGNFFPAFLFTFAETQLSTGLTGILNGFTPFFTLLIGFVVFKRKATMREIIGLSIAFVGMVYLILEGNGDNFEISWIHVGAVILASLMYGTSLNTIKSNLTHLKSWEITALSFSIMLFPSLAALFFFETPKTVQSNSHAYEGLFYIGILAVVGTCFALVLFNRLIARKTIVFASSVTYIMPIIAVFNGVVFQNEQLFVAQFIGMILVVGGIYWANKPAK